MIRDLSHQSAFAHCTRPLAKAAVIVAATVSSPANMAPFGARAAGPDNSPISIVLPAGGAAR